MDPRTLELLRALQADDRDAASLERICQQFREQRRALSAKDDRATIDELCELLEAWAETATADLASIALQETALSIEEDLEQPARAIAVLERVLDLEPSTDALAQLARLYTQRNGEGDRAQAAELYSALGETLGEEGRPWLERALNLVPTHESALEALEALVPEAERAQVLRERYVAYLEKGGDSKVDEGQETNKAGDRRRLELSRAYAAEGAYRDALVFISPLAERGNSEAGRLKEAYLANLEGAVAPTKRGAKADSLPPPRHVRPARSGGTMVGFRLDEYHDALRQEQDGPSDPQEAQPGVDNASGLQAKVESQPQPQAQATAKRASAPAEKPAMLKTQLGVGRPVATANEAAKPSASDEPSEDSVVRAMPRAASELSHSAVTSNGDVAAATPATESEPAPARRSLPPPNPEIVRASSPASTSSSGAQPAAQPAVRRSSAGQAVAASRPDTRISSPRPQLHLAPISTPAARAASAIPAPVFAPIPATLPMAAGLPMAATELAPAQPMAGAEPESFAAAPSSLDDELPSARKSAPRAKWPFAVGGVAIIAAAAWAMMDGKPEVASAPVAPVAAEPAKPIEAAPPPPPSVATTTTTLTAGAPVAAGAAPAAGTTTATEAATAVPAPEVAAPKPEAKTVNGTVKPIARDVRVKGGKISSTQVLASFEGSLTKINHCYEEALEDNPKVDGRATLTFSIVKTGKLSAPKLTKSTLKNAKLERCTLDAVRNERFSKVKKTARVTLPLTFTR